MKKQQHGEVQIKIHAESTAPIFVSRTVATPLLDAHLHEKGPPAKLVDKFPKVELALNL